MTELEQARAHLASRQERLARSRKGEYVEDFGGYISHEMLVRERTRLTNEVLAALSWVWDSQERAFVQAAKEEPIIGQWVRVIKTPEQTVLPTLDWDSLIGKFGRVTHRNCDAKGRLLFAVQMEDRGPGFWASCDMIEVVR